MLKSRKFALALLLVALATGLRALTLVDQAGWLQVVELVGKGYFVANVGQKAVEAVPAIVAAVKAALQPAAGDAAKAS